MRRPRYAHLNFWLRSADDLVRSMLGLVGSAGGTAALRLVNALRARSPALRLELLVRCDAHALAKAPGLRQ